MGTRSWIGMEKKNGSVHYIYCHWDGYPEHTGSYLINNINSPKEVYALISGGDRSTIEGGFRETYAFKRKAEWKDIKPFKVKSRKDYWKAFSRATDIKFAYLYLKKKKWVYRGKWGKYGSVDRSSLLSISVANIKHDNSIATNKDKIKA